MVLALSDDARAYVGNEDECHRFVEAVMWIDTQWRFLPAEYGNWNNLYKRFVRWF